jgi:hypothetical protein
MKRNADCKSEISNFKSQISNRKSQISNRKSQTPGFKSASRRGISLLEVLAAIGVLSVGMLSLAALLPVGRYTIGEATKADHAGDCGRAALHDVIVRRMLDSNNWQGNAGSGSFFIDPYGLSLGAPGTLGGLPVITLKNVNPQSFMATDDLIVTLPEEMNPARQPGRPINVNPTNPSALAPLTYKGDFSWFLTVTPTPTSSTRFTVSAVVCIKRDNTQQTAGVTTFYDQGYGGGSVMLGAPLDLRINDWIALCGGGLCQWYRVVAAGNDGESITLVGPDWNPATAATAVTVGQEVLGVYTTTVELDTDPTWKN